LLVIKIIKMPPCGTTRSWGLASKARRPLLPRNMQHLTNEMLMRRLLKEIYDTDWSNVESMSVHQKKPQPGDITGNLSESGRVEVRLTMSSGEKVVHNWFVKIMPKQHKNSELMHKFNIFENEIAFYRDTAPDLLAFLKVNGIEDIVFDIPKLLFSESTDEGAVIILDDVCEQGYSQERDSQGCRYLSLEQAILALDSLARLQAASKLHAAHEGERRASVGTSQMWEDEEFLDRLAIMKEAYCEVLSKSSEQDSDKLLQRFQKTFDSGEKLREVCAERYAPKHTSAVYLQHGDFHYNNLLFKEEEGKLKVMLVDWQLTYTGRSTGDVSYLLLSSISPEVRHVHEQQLKESYFNSFNSYLKTFEASVIGNQSDAESDWESDSESDSESIEVEDLEHDYQDSAPLSLFLSCGNVLSGSEQQEQATLTFAYNLVRDAAVMHII